MTVDSGQSKNELSKNVKIINELGLHARAAAKIATLARNAKAKVWIAKDKERVDAASVIDILTLACVPGTAVVISVEDPADVNILNEIETLVNKKFGE